MWVHKLNMVKYADRLTKTYETITKVRYNDEGTPARITQIGDGIKVQFHEGVFAIAPGQAAVFYEGNDVIGGGWIMSSFKHDDQN